MARIPIGNFGNAIPDPAPRYRVPINDGGAAGLANLGANMQQAAIGMHQDEIAAKLEQQRKDAELARAKAANALLDREIEVDLITNDIRDQVSTGKLPYTDAHKQYSDRLSSMPKIDIGTADPVIAENYAKGVKRIEFKGKGAVDKIYSDGQQIELRASADGLIDKIGKQASLPDANPSQLNATLDQLDEIGQRAYGQAWAKKKQDAKDANWSNHLDQQARMVRNSLEGIADMQKRLSEGDLADKLDSNKRNALMARLDGYQASILQRNEAASARADREYERRLKYAEHEYNAFLGMADKGLMLSPDYVDRVSIATAGTPYADAVHQVARQVKEAGGLAFQPIADQQKTLDGINREISQQGITPELDRRRGQIEKVLAASQEDLKRDGLRAGLERGVIRDLAPIDTSTPDALAKSLQGRALQAQTVATWAGKPVSPLDAREAEQLRNMLDILPAKQKSAAVATIADSLGPQLSGALADQLDKQDKALRYAFASASDKTTLGRYTSELILSGAAAIKDGAVMKDDKKVTGWKATIAGELDGVFPDQQLADSAKEAAFLIAAGIAKEGGGTASTSDLERAVGLAIGGRIIDYRDQRLPVPAGMDASDFETRIRSVSQADVLKQAPDGKVRAGGVEMSAADFVAAIPGQDLMYAGPGLYAVLVKGRPVTNSAGRPITIGVQ